MKRFLCVFLCAALLALSAVSVPAAEVADDTDTQPALEKGAYAPGQVIVQFRDSVTDTDRLSPKRELAAVGADFGEMMDASSSRGEAYAAGREAADILSESLGNDYVLEDTLVFAGDKAADEAIASTGASPDASSGDFSVALVSSEKYDTEALIRKLRANQSIAAVEPNYLVQLQSCEYSLNDPLNWYNYQANSPLDHNTGGDNVSARGDTTEGYLSTNAGHGWNKLTGDEDEVVVAVIDSGVNTTHEDLEDMLWTNPGDIGLEGEHGFNFWDNQDDVTDSLGHGTHCSGIIAAQANNGIGTAGVASGANMKLMMCSTASAYGDSAEGNTYFYRELGALSYVLKAKQRGVNIVATSNSWGAPGNSEIYDDVINRLGEEGVLTFAAAGNDNDDLDMQSYSPAGGNSPYLVSVGAANIDGSLARFSNYGKAKVDLCAPGVNVLSTVGYRVYFPNIASREERSRTTEYYGVFDGNAKVEGGSVTPALTDCDASVKPFGASVFRVQNRMGQAVADSEAVCEMAVTPESVFTRSDRPASLKITIRNVNMDEQYYLYFPFQKNPDTIGSGNTDFSIYLTHHYSDNEYVSAVLGGEVLIDADGNCSMTGGGMLGSVNDREHNGISTHISCHGAHSEVIQSADTLGDNQTGIGVCISPRYAEGSADTITMYLDSIAVSKPDAALSKDSSYDIMSGTSMATPAAAGAYAVLAALYPRQEGQSGSDYALENRARLLSCVTKTEALRDACAAGGYLDLSRIGEENPVMMRAECDTKEEAVVISGANLSPEYQLSYRRTTDSSGALTALPSNGMTVSYAPDGRSVEIRHAKALFSTDTEFVLTDGDRIVARVCDFLVKGQKQLNRVYTEPFPQSIGNPYFYPPRRQLLTDTKGEALYGYDVSSGVVSKYNGVQFYNLEGTDLTESVYAYFQSRGLNVYEARQNLSVDMLHDDPPLYVNNKLYRFVKVDCTSGDDEFVLNDGSYYFLASIDYTSDHPAWTFSKSASFERIFGMSEIVTRSLISCEGKIYCLGNGYPRGKEEQEPFMFSYDIAEGTWTEEKALPEMQTAPMLCAKDGKIYVILGTVSEESGRQHLSDVIYCYENGDWTKLPGIPYVGDTAAVESQMTSITKKGACTAVKDGIVFINCPVDGGGNAFLYRTDTGECEPLYYTMTGYKANRSNLYSAIETQDGIYYIELTDDHYLEKLELYLLPSDSGAYTPGYRTSTVYGDVDGDGEVSVLDVTLLQRYLSQMDVPKAFDLTSADADGDGDVGITDVTCIQRYLANMPNGKGRTGESVL